MAMTGVHMGKSDHISIQEVRATGVEKERGREEGKTRRVRIRLL
jgi:hypothetical protein